MRHIECDVFNYCTTAFCLHPHATVTGVCVCVCVFQCFCIKPTLSVEAVHVQEMRLQTLLSQGLTLGRTDNRRPNWNSAV
jgi:hypothetical protein